MQTFRVPRGVTPGDHLTRLLYYRVKYLRTGKIDRHKKGMETFMVLRRCILMTLLIPWSKEMLPSSVVEHQEPKYIMTLRDVVIKHTKKAL